MPAPGPRRSARLARQTETSLTLISKRSSLCCAFEKFLVVVVALVLAQKRRETVLARVAGQPTLPEPIGMRAM